MRLLQQRIAIVAIDHCDNRKGKLHSIIMEENHGAFQQGDFLF
jgi:hypothetical protein